MVSSDAGVRGVARSSADGRSAPKLAVTPRDGATSGGSASPTLRPRGAGVRRLDPSPGGTHRGSVCGGVGCIPSGSCARYGLLETAGLRLITGASCGHGPAASSKKQAVGRYYLQYSLAPHRTALRSPTKPAAPPHPRAAAHHQRRTHACCTGGQQQQHRRRHHHYHQPPRPRPPPPPAARPSYRVVSYRIVSLRLQQQQQQQQQQQGQAVPSLRRRGAASSRPCLPAPSARTVFLAAPGPVPQYYSNDFTNGNQGSWVTRVTYES